MFYVLITSVALLLYCPVMALICILTPWQGFRTATMQRRNKRYNTLHLSIYDRVGCLNRHRSIRFHKSFIATLSKILKHENTPVYFMSHLLRPTHFRSMREVLASQAPSRRWRSCQVKIPRVIRIGIRVQILLQEWRWITVPETGVLVVIRPINFRLTKGLHTTLKPS